MMNLLVVWRLAQDEGTVTRFSYSNHGGSFTALVNIINCATAPKRYCQYWNLIFSPMTDSGEGSMKAQEFVSETRMIRMNRWLTELGGEFIHSICMEFQVPTSTLLC